jgi:hypothetical protein
MLDSLHLTLVRLEQHLLTEPVLCHPISHMSQTKDWPHAPVHRIGSHSIYMVTGATLHKASLFASKAKLSLLEETLLTLAK